MTRPVLPGIEANEAGNSGHDVADWDPVTVLLHTLPTTNMRGGRPLTANFVFIYCALLYSYHDPVATLAILPQLNPPLYIQTFCRH